VYVSFQKLIISLSLSKIKPKVVVVCFKQQATVNLKFIDEAYILTRTQNYSTKRFAIELKIILYLEFLRLSRTLTEDSFISLNKIV